MTWEATKRFHRRMVSRLVCELFRMRCEGLTPNPGGVGYMPGCMAMFGLRDVRAMAHGLSACGCIGGEDGQGES